MSLYRRKDSPYWWSKLYQDGKSVSFSTGERHKVAALRVERDRAAQLQDQARLTGRYSLLVMAAKFIVWKEADGRAEGTVSKIEEHLTKRVLPFLGKDRDIRTVQVRDLEEYKTKRMSEVSAQTVCKELSSLRQLLRYAADVHKVMDRAPTVKNPRLRLEAKWRLLTPEQVNTLIGELGKFGGRGKEALPYFLLLANTGMRGGEASGLTWEMVDTSGNALHLPATITKNRKARTVPLNEMAQGVIGMMKGDHAKGRVFAYRKHYTAWRKACKAAGLGDKKGERPRPHDLRHTFGSLLHAAGRSGPEVRDILGHLTLYMANLYAHTYQAKLHEAVAMVQLGGSAQRSHKRSLADVPSSEKRRDFVSFCEFVKTA